MADGKTIYSSASRLPAFEDWFRQSYRGGFDKDVNSPINANIVDKAKKQYAQIQSDIEIAEKKEYGGKNVYWGMVNGEPHFRFTTAAALKEQEQQRKRSQLASESQRRFDEAMAEKAFQEGQKLDSRGFSQNFLKYLQSARAQKLQQGAADITKTGAETGLLGAQSGLASAQAGRIAAMTPFEIANLEAQSGLYGEQAGKTRAETLGEYGLTAPSQAAMFATTAGGRASLMNAQANLMQAGGTQTTKMGPDGMEMITTRPVGVGMGAMDLGADVEARKNAYAAAQAKRSNAASKGGTLSYFSPIGASGYELYTPLPPPPPRKDINVGLGGPTYGGNFASYGNYPVTGSYNQRSRKE